MRSDSNAPAPLSPGLEELMRRYQQGDTTAVAPHPAVVPVFCQPHDQQRRR